MSGRRGINRNSSGKKNSSHVRSISTRRITRQTLCKTKIYKKISLRSTIFAAGSIKGYLIYLISFLYLVTRVWHSSSFVIRADWHKTIGTN